MRPPVLAPPPPMLTLKLILVLVLLGWSLYSAVVYWSRRGDNKQALQSLQNDATPARPLSADESAALAPFLFEPAKPDRPMPLHRDGVFALHGEYVRHGLHTSQGGETMHDTIGGVEVILPYDARDFLEPLNRADVVFTEKFAIVVRLNDSFDLLGGRSRASRRQQQDQQWQTGRAGEVSDVEPLGADDMEGLDAATVREVLRVEMLGQRDETPAEAEARAGDGRAWLAALAWLLAIVLLLVASEVEPAQRLFWATPAAALAALALWATWGPRRAPTPGKVNRVRGHVAAIAMAKPGGGAGLVRWFVGDKFPVELPAHWKARWTAPPQGPVDVDIRVADHTAVRFGKALSVDDEVTRFRPVRWGRHLLLSVTGALALGGVWLWASGLSNDLVLTSAWLRGTPALTADTPEALAAATPSVGTWVHLHGRAACHWTASGAERSHLDCATLRWDTSAPSASPVTVDDLTRALHTGAFLHTRNNIGLNLMLQMQMAGRGTDPLARYRAMADTPKVVTGLAELIRTVNTACPEASGPCQRLQSELAQGLLVDGDDAPTTWAAWTQHAANGRLTGDSDVAVMRGAVARSVQSNGRLVAEDRASRLIAEALATRQAAAPTNVLLSVLPGTDTRLPVAPEEIDVLGVIDAMNAGEAGEPFDVAGLLVAHGTSDGVPVWHIDASRRLDDPWSSVMRAGALAITLLLLAGHGVVFVLRVAQARRRGRDVAAFIDQRMPAQGFGA